MKTLSQKTALLMVLSLSAAQLVFAGGVDGGGGKDAALIRYVVGHNDIFTKMTISKALKPFAYTGPKIDMQDPKVVSLYKEKFCKASKVGIEFMETLTKIDERMTKLHGTSKKINFGKSEILGLEEVRTLLCWNEAAKFSLDSPLMVNGEQVTMINYKDGSIEMDPYSFESSTPGLQIALSTHELVSNPILGLEKTNGYAVSACLVKNFGAISAAKALLTEADQKMTEDIISGLALPMPGIFFGIGPGRAVPQVIQAVWLKDFSKEERAQLQEFVLSGRLKDGHIIYDDKTREKIADFIGPKYYKFVSRFAKPVQIGQYLRGFSPDDILLSSNDSRLFGALATLSRVSKASLTEEKMISLNGLIAANDFQHVWSAFEELFPGENRDLGSSVNPDAEYNLWVELSAHPVQLVDCH